MANLKNWLPEMSAAERKWFDKCPKAVLFEISRQFAMRIDGNLTPDAAFPVMHDEWHVLYQQGLVPHKPAKINEPAA